MTVATRHCIKCGAEVGPDQSMCERCNAAGMVPPSATQVHGTIAAAIGVGFLLLALLGLYAVRGQGPYSGQVRSWEAAADGSVAVVVSVSNAGTEPGRARCSVAALDGSGLVLQRALALSPTVPPGTSLLYDALIPRLDTSAVTNVQVDCR